MADRIEIYIKNEKIVVSEGFVRPVIDHPCLDRNISRVQRILSENDRLALEFTEQFANDKGLPVEVYDVHTFKGKLKAWLKGISTTPTIIVGTSRIEGELTPEQLKCKLQSCTT
jgi:hypothetical protein